MKRTSLTPILSSSFVKFSLPGSKRQDSMAEQVFIGQSEARTEGREEELGNLDTQVELEGELKI